MVNRSLLVLTAGFILYCFHDVVAQEKKTDLDRIQGTWKMTKVEVEGKPPPPEYVAKGKFLFKDRKVSILQDDKTVEEATFVLDSLKKPSTIDLTPTTGPNKDKIIYGIYRIDADSLTICIGDPGDKRPTEFKVQGKSGVLQFERVKPKK